MANKAVLSNKEDTEKAIELFSSALEEVEIIKTAKEDLEKRWNEHLQLDIEKEKRLNNLYTFGNFTIPLISLTLLGTSAYFFSTEDFQKGMNLVYAAGISLITLEVIYQGGHFVFKFW